MTAAEGFIRVALVRHGETDWTTAGIFQGQSGPGLNPNGVTEVMVLAKVLPAHVLQAGLIVSSDLERAQQTTHLLQQHLPDCRHHVDSRWRETNVGTWTGKTIHEMASEDPCTTRAWLLGEDVRRGGGETREETLHRVKEALVNAMTEVRDLGSNTLMVVSHGGPIHFLVAASLGLWPDGYMHLETPRTASLSVLTIEVRNANPLSGTLEVYNSFPGKRISASLEKKGQVIG